MEQTQPTVAEKIAQIRMVLRRQWLTPIERLDLEKALTKLLGTRDPVKSTSMTP
jgi:hypothetical protein